jgi:hypothetical protein
MVEVGLVCKIKLNKMNLQTLLTGWNFMRFLRLGVGIFIGIQAVQYRDVLSGLIASVFLLQAATNTGCCGNNACATNTNYDSKNTIQDVEFEEVVK